MLRVSCHLLASRALISSSRLVPPGRGPFPPAGLAAATAATPPATAAARAAGSSLCRHRNEHRKVRHRTGYTPARIDQLAYTSEDRPASIHQLR